VLAYARTAPQVIRGVLRTPERQPLSKREDTGTPDVTRLILLVAGALTFILAILVAGTPAGERRFLFRATLGVGLLTVAWLGAEWRRKPFARKHPALSVLPETGRVVQVLAGGRMLIEAGGTTWHARATVGQAPVVGEEVRVRAREGLTLVIEAVAREHSAVEQADGAVETRRVL
jgi:membrane protein implicated in regulation of membrane protease activity